MKIDRGTFWRGIAVAAIGIAMASAQAKQPVGEDWVKHDKSNVNLTDVLGADGKSHSAMCSGYPDTNSDFSFWSKKGKSKNLAVFFEGGGACWDNLTCTFPIDDRVTQLNQYLGLPPQSEIPQFFVPAIDANTNPNNYEGIFNSNDPRNPIKDWTIVYIPYCTGDLHTGSTTKDYYNARSAVLPPELIGLLPPLDSAPTPITIQHRGFDNFMVVLDWMKKNVEKPNNVLVTGSSAGGYGATANFPWIERTFRNAHTYVIADASQGVTTRGFDLYGRTSWNMQLAPWAFGNNPSAIAGPDLLRKAAKALPHVKTAQFTTAFDETQIAFYGYMRAAYGFAGFYGGGGTCPNVPIDWNHQMLGTLRSYVADVPNFRYFLAEGSYHTLMRSTRFYTEDSPGINFSEWVDEMLGNRGGTGGHGGDWRNAASAVSLYQLPCR